ncbi:MAG: signal recognition particle protein, partial [Hydrogenophilales bacterium]|nr:signal recognition particle protein [Hydrogenophilales bacterium]
LARLYAKEGKKVLLVAADLQRPAAVEQLQVLGNKISVPVFSVPGSTPVEVCKRALAVARVQKRDMILIDTAGRLAIDAPLMTELQDIKAETRPHNILLVVNAQIGQNALQTANAFHERLGLTGVVLTMLDGDARGGAALSVRQITGKPIKFAGVSEKPTGLEPFYPDRMAQRILGMGDVLSLIEETQRQVDHEETARLTKKLKSGKGFDLEDFKTQLQQMQKMGGLSALMDKLPGNLAQAAQGKQVDDKALHRVEGIINSMTPAERRNPALLKASRKRRIAAGAGVPVQEINRLLSQFEQMQKMMKTFSKGGMGKMMRGMKGMLPGM